MGTDGFTRETVNPFHTHAIFVPGVEMEILVLQCQTMKEDVILFVQLGSARKWLFWAVPGEPIIAYFVTVVAQSKCLQNAQETIESQAIHANNPSMP